MKEKRQLNYAQRWRIELYGSKCIDKINKRKIFALVLFGILFFTLLTLPWVWEYKLKYDIDKAEKSVSLYDEANRIIHEKETLEADLSKFLSFLNAAEKNSKNPKEVFMQIKKLLPAEAKINSFSFQTDYSVQISLILNGPADVADLWVNFRDSGLFVDFDMETVSLIDNNQNLNLTLKLKQ